MSKKRLGGRRPHWPNHGKSCVIFPFYPIHAKARTCCSDLRNNLGGAILTSYRMSSITKEFLKAEKMLRRKKGKGDKGIKGGCNE